MRLICIGRPTFGIVLSRLKRGTISKDALFKSMF